MNRFRLVVIAALSFVAAACATTSASHSWWSGSLTIDNDSNYAVHHLFLTPAHAIAWGPDQLGTDVLFPHEIAHLSGLDCSDYDLKLIDDDGDECVVEDIDLCLQDAHWHLTDAQLSACSGFRK